MKQFSNPVVIVLAYNKHSMTQGCIEALHAHTEEPIDIILVDNGSTPAFET
ncbi:MAG: glycosyltransferase family 2 protein, partial [Deltaproteobacteria bacterium]|nr:glycosyltransferase family 2 protein [Deltaproteobacteria bacterium]